MIIHIISSQLTVGDAINQSYVWCNFFNFVMAYFFCLPWFIFLGDTLIYTKLFQTILSEMEVGPPYKQLTLFTL